MDPVARRQFWELIRGLRADGATVLLTTHYLDEAAELADRVGVVADGRLVEVAPPDELGAELRRLATVRWTEHGVAREVRTESPAAVLRDLLARPGDVPGLTVTRPSLEDVYLSLVGVASTVPPFPPLPRETSDDRRPASARPGHAGAPPRSAVGRAHRRPPSGPGAAAVLPGAPAGGVLLRLPGDHAGHLRGGPGWRRAAR
ncbi:hypothetical protein [Blastococcus brunescens]